MSSMTVKNLLLGAGMLLAAGLAVAMKPAPLDPDKVAEVKLESLFPAQIGDWVQEDDVVELLVTPELQRVIEETYSQTLSRTYVNPEGRRVMLSVAYGGTHGEGMQTHRPEVCYPAQGFQVVSEISPAMLDTPLGGLTVKRLAAEQGPRHEPITYWVVVGKEQTQFGLGMRFAQLRYTLTGVIPDGMLVRLSTIGRDDELAYDDHADFIRALATTVSPEARERIFGQMSPAV